MISGNSFSLEATRGSSGEGFEFILNGSSVGSYLAKNNDVSFTPASSVFGYAGINPANVNENTGSVTITSINTTNQTVSGIFNYKGYWSDGSVTNILPIVFSNGVFNNLPYVTQNPSNNSFFALVDGITFVDTNVSVNTVSNVIGITATNVSNQNITIGIRDNVTPGVAQAEKAGFIDGGLFGLGGTNIKQPVSVVSGNYDLVLIEAEKVTPSKAVGNAKNYDSFIIEVYVKDGNSTVTPAAIVTEVEKLK